MFISERLGPYKLTEPCKNVCMLHKQWAIVCPAPPQNNNKVYTVPVLWTVWYIKLRLHWIYYFSNTAANTEQCTPCYHTQQHVHTIYSVSQKKVAPLKLFAIFSLVVNLCN